MNSIIIAIIENGWQYLLAAPIFIGFMIQQGWITVGTQTEPLQAIMRNVSAQSSPLDDPLWVVLIVVLGIFALGLTIKWMYDRIRTWVM